MAAFPLDIRTELNLNGIWTDVSGDVYLRDPKVISRGRRDQGSATDPSTLSLTLNNRDGKYSPRNAMSPLYGLIGRNTRVRVSVPGPSVYAQMEPHGPLISTPFTPDLNVTGDLDVRAEVTMSWHRPGDQTIVGRWEPTGDQRSWLLRVSDGSLHLVWAPAGAAGGTVLSWPVPPTMPEHSAVRVTHSLDAATNRTVVQFFRADTIAGPWKLMYRWRAIGIFPLYSTTAPLVIAPTDTAYRVPRLPFYGRVHAVEVRDGIDGPVLADPDFTAQAPGTASFSDSAGRVWTLTGTAVRDREDRFVGEVSTWPAKWSVDGSDVWTPVQASGILRRLGQGQKPLDSALRRRIPSGSPVAYWPFEDERMAARAYSPLPGVDPAAVTGIEFGEMDTLVSSAPLPRLTAAASLSAKVPASMPSGDWQVEFAYTADDKVPTDYTEVISVSSPNGTVRRWQVLMKKDTGWIRGYDASGTDIVDQKVGLGSDVFHGWLRLKLWASQSAGNVSWWAVWDRVGGSAGGIGRTFAGTTGRVSYVTADWGAATEGWGFGHLTVLPSANNGLMDDSEDAYHGETAVERLARLTTEEHIPLDRIPGPLPTQHVGYQRQGTILSLLEAAAEADGGMLMEDRSRVGLVYRDRSSLYTQDPALTLSYTAPGLGPDLEPVDDDSDVRNDITVTRDGGSSGRATLNEGTLSVQPPPAGIGLYDESVTLSLADDTQPEPVAHWRLHLGTFDGARFPTVSVTLHKPGADVHVPAVLGLREGDKIRITDLPAWVAHGPVDLIVQGWTETLEPYRWELVFNCSPAGPWNLAQADHPVYAKADTDGSALTAAVNATDTTLTVQSAGAPWVQANPVLNANPSMATDLSDWTGAGATLARVPVPASARLRESWAMTITPDGVAQYPNAGSGMIPVVPDQEVVLSGWVSSSTTRNVALNINWFDATYTYLSTSANDQVVNAGSWKWFELSAVAPPGAVYVNLAPTVPDTPPPTDVLTVTRVTLRVAGGSPRDFPVPIQVGGEVMEATAIGQWLNDTFGRSVANGWGTASSGQTWGVRGFAGAGDYSVTAGSGVHTLSSRNVYRYSVLEGLSVADVETVVTIVAPDVLPTGDGVSAFSLARVNADGTTFYAARLYFSTTGSATLSLRKRVPTESILATAATMPAAAGQAFRLRLRIKGQTLSARAWPASSPEPSGWQVSVQDTSLPGPGTVGLRSFIGNSNTNTLPLTVRYNDFAAADGAQAFTVTRSVNGVIKSHPAGAAVRLAHTAIASL